MDVTVKKKSEFARVKKSNSTIMRKVCNLIVGTLLILGCAASVARNSPAAGIDSKTLDIYFIDTEGGAATLVVTPAGEALLVDSGNPGARDAGRIARVAIEVAGLKQIDHYVTTHYHADHFGGIARLVELIPVRRFYDRGTPIEPLTKDVKPDLLQIYKRTAFGKTTALKPGDRIDLKRGRGKSPAIDLRVVAADGYVYGEAAGAPQTQPCGENFKPLPDDRTDNRRSIAFVLSFGKFQFFGGGDLTWNTENRLVCPKNLVGAVDVYQSDHHGVDISNNPALVAALEPRVVVLNNGARKGGSAKTFATLRNAASVKDIFQLHRNVLTSAADNAPAEFTANDEENCTGEFVKLSVDRKAKKYAVGIPSKKTTRVYRVK